VTIDPLPIQPLGRPLSGRVRVPGSKSLTNRALLVAALAEGTTTLTNALFSDDSRYCAEALAQLGFLVRQDTETLTMTVSGLGGRIPAARAKLYVGNAGTAARFLTALLTLGQGEYVLDGNERMRARPIADLLPALAQLGADVSSATGSPPVRVRAGGLMGGSATVNGDVSSQFLSGLLLVSPYAQNLVELRVAGELNSKPYVDLTLAVMADFGVSVERDGYARFCIEPQRYRARAEYAIESDASAASYFFAAPAILGGTLRVDNLTRRARQGDVAFLDVLAAMGCTVTEGAGWTAVTGPASGALRGVDIDMRHIPDTAQTLAAIAPFASTPTTVRGIASARVKETDRVAACCAELRRLGVRVDEYPDGFKVYPAAQVQPAVVHTYDDHRMAMAFALVGLRSPGISIENPGCVAKTFPGYWEVVAGLGGGTADGFA
jgi:3-phosphoshikimate 1-carboxyvinyltransferase